MPIWRLLSLLILKITFFSTSATYPSSLENEVILNLHQKCPGNGGVETHLSFFSKIFSQHGVKNVVLTSHNSTWLQQVLKQQGNDYALYYHDDDLPKATDIMLQCLNYKVTTIVCNFPEHVQPSLEVKEALHNQQPIKVVLLYHAPDFDFLGQHQITHDNPSPNPIMINLINKTQGFATVNPAVAEYARSLVKKNIFSVPQIGEIPPFWRDTVFLQFVPQHSRQHFFTDVLHIDMPDAWPVITMVARFGPNKNHALLLRAVASLRIKYKKPFKLMLAGSGGGFAKLKALTCDLGIQEFVHFLDSIPDSDVIELLYHSNIHILPSYCEGFGISHVEAALMKKPFVGTENVGVMTKVNKGITQVSKLRGLPFVNNDVTSLTDTLEFLLDNPDMCKKMGENAHDFVLQEFSSEATFNKWVNFFSTMKNQLREQ